MKLADDYYQLLGVERDADQTVIKRAFRRKARELHPDVNPDNPNAEEQFRQVSEAYEVLSDDERRGIYDRYGADGLKQGGAWQPRHEGFTDLGDIFSAFFGDDVFGGAAGRGRRQYEGEQGESVAVAVNVTFAEAALGTSRDIDYDVTTACATCSGDGAAPDGRESCERCEGQGVIRSVARSLFGQVVQESVCPRCGGQGSTITTACESCEGTGQEHESRSVTVDVPGGIQDGQRIRVSGRGGEGLRGGPAGHLYLDVSVENDERFMRDGDDLLSILDLTVSEATLGCTKQVEIVDGDEVDVTIEAGTQPGEMVTLDGRGVGRLRGSGRGDHRILLNVRIPTDLTTEQEAVFGDFSELETERNYTTDEGFIDKLRRLFRG